MIKHWIASILDTFSRRRDNVEPREQLLVSEGLRNRISLLMEDVLQRRWASEVPWHDPDSYLREIHRVLQHAYGRTHFFHPWTSTTHVEDLSRFVRYCTPAEYLDYLEAIFKARGLEYFAPDENELAGAFNEILRAEGTLFRITPSTREPIPPSTKKQRQGTTHTIIEYPKVILIEDNLAYQEAIAPALVALSASDMKGANSEFRRALDDFKKADFPDCLAKCGSCFESVLKVLCVRNSWQFKPTDTARPLIDTVIENAGIDRFYSDPFLLIATMRNRLSSAHGGGVTPRQVEEFQAQYCLTSTAAAIAFLAKAATKEHP